MLFKGFLVTLRITLEKLFLRNPHVDHSVNDLYRVSRDINHRGQLHGFAISHIELAPMARADNVITFQVPVAHRPVVMRTDIANGKKLARDVENDQ